MFLRLFVLLRAERVPVTVPEYLTLLEALKVGAAQTPEDFYALARAILIKRDEHLDVFDRVFAQYMGQIATTPEPDLTRIAEEWLRQNSMLHLTDEEKAMIEAFGGLDALADRFRQLLEEQKERHEGGNRWIGTGGTSPFGANGYNPAGYRIGQAGSRHRRAVKVWDKREFRDLSDKEELNTRNLKMALRRLRLFTRTGQEEELDIDQTISRTSRNAGYLDIAMRPPRKNNVKVLLLMDIGGSMDDHVMLCSKLFSAARHEFKHLEFFYFHNCLYERVWKENRRRWSEHTLTWDLLHRFNSDYKLIFVGDSAMSPTEILFPGGSVEHNNPEAGEVWLKRATNHFRDFVWINPNPETSWDYFESTRIIKNLMTDRMFPLTLNGLSEAIKSLKKPNKAATLAI